MELNRALRVASFAAFTLCASAARAASPTDELVAQQAFDEARALFRDGKVPAACAKFETSQRLRPKLGTLLNLAICHERQGKLALAWSEFYAARADATAEKKPDRVDFADTRLAAIAPKLGHLRFAVDPSARASHAVITLDGSPVAEAAWDTDIPVDPGPHAIVVTAPRSKPWRDDSETVAAGEMRAVKVPALAVDDSAPIAPPADPPPQAPGSDSHAQRTVGWITAGVGVAGIGVGTVFGLMAVQSRKDAEALCNQGNCAAGQSKNSSGVTQAWVSNVGLIAGGLALVTGVVLVLTDHGSARARVGLGSVDFELKF